MRFTLSEKIITTANISKVKNTLKNNLSEISRYTEINNSKILVEGVHETFGSINKKDNSEIEIKELDKGFLIKCHVNYRPSFAFWIILLITLFTWIGWLIPIIMYFYHKSLVENTLKEALKNSKDELELITSKKSD